MTAVMGAFVTDHTKQTVVFAADYSTQRQLLGEIYFGGVFGGYTPKGKHRT